MGCVFPKPVAEDENDKSNIFKVVNIDQDGNGHYPGKIEITSDYLLLYQDKKEPLSWPIRSLRRYGFERNIFSFEVGRRCPTGEGIFAFRCDQAEQLFRLLQNNIQRSSNNPNLPHNDCNHGGHYLEPRVVNVRDFRLQSVGSTSSCPHTPISPTQPSVYNFDSADVERNRYEKKDTGIAVTNCSSNASSPVYINVPTSPENVEEPSTSQNAYIYLTEKIEKHHPAPLLLPSSNEQDTERQSLKNVKYITLEFDSKVSSPVVKTPTEEDGLSPKYSMIDLQKTWALSQSTKPNIENDIGCTRRTRHNSNLFGVYR